MATAADLITQIRDQLRDANTAYQWTNAKILRYMEAIKAEIYGDHPESVLVSDTSVTDDPPSTIDETTDEVPLRQEYHLAIIHGVCWKCFLEDTDDDANVALADKHHDLYVEAMR